MVRVKSARAAAPASKASARHSIRGHETRKAILRAATRLFATRDYDSVTMRDIARAAACSHTAIYLYFKDKESLLEAIVFPALEALRGALQAIMETAGLGAEEKLLRMGRAVVDFSLSRRSRSRVFFATRASRVDVPQEEGSLNHTRIGIFAMLSHLCGSVLGLSPEDPRTLAAGRTYFFMLNGIISTYDQNLETTKALTQRLGATFDLALRSCISGLRAQLIHAGTKGQIQ
jgi:AcrR family transcriptional regulator